MRVVTRRLEFDAGHRLIAHESKCRNLHGHRYVAEICVGCETLDKVGRVIDFGEVKRLVGGWIDEHWDHGMLLNEADVELIELCERSDWKVYSLGDVEPTAENIVTLLAEKAQELLWVRGITVVSVRLYETPNCWADWTLGAKE